MGTQPKTIAIDFDGVIHKYSAGWKDGTIYDDEIPGVFESIKALCDSGYSIVILSTREPKQIKKWLLPKIMISDYEHSGPGNDPTEWVAPRYGYTCKIIPKSTKFWNEMFVIGITNRKIPAHVYLDDRGLKFNGDWTQSVQDIITYKTYQDESKAANH